MEYLFTSLSRAVQGTAAVALGASFLWGVLSIVLSPCHLASLPLIVAYIDEQGRMSTRRAMGISTLFAAGILVTIAIVGAITAAAGRLLGDLGAWGNWVVAAVFFGVGLHLIGVIPLPLGPASVTMKRRGLLAAAVLGLIYGLALGPCTFAFMAPMLAETFRVAQTHLAYGLALLAAYGLGHCSVIILAGTGAGWVQSYLNWNERSKGAVIVKRLCGVLILAAGVYLIYLAR